MHQQDVAQHIVASDGGPGSPLAAVRFPRCSVLFRKRHRPSPPQVNSTVMLPRPMRSLCLIFFAAAVVPQISCAPSDPAYRNCGPSHWKLAEMLVPIQERFQVRAFDEAGLLAWQVAEDDRPLYVETAVVAARSNGTWFLAKLYRHPRREHNDWEMAVVLDAPRHVPAQDYNAPPSPSQIQTFRVRSWWERGHGGSFRILDEGECAAWWANDE